MATHKHTSKGKSNNAFTVTAILAIALGISVIIHGFTIVTLLQGGVPVPSPTGNDQAAAPAPSPTQPSAPSPSPTAAPTVEVSVDDDAAKGAADAPVTIVEFSDYECPFCGRFYTQTLPQLEQNYIDTGKVRLVYRDFPLSFHPRATPSAIAAECVQEVGGDEAYWQMHDTIFENQGSLDDQSLRTYASQTGIDMAAWDTCYADEDGSIAAEVQADFREGQAAGVSGTPEFFVNGQKIVGAQPYEVFEQAIEEALG